MITNIIHDIKIEPKHDAVIYIYERIETAFVSVDFARPMTADLAASIREINQIDTDTSNLELDIINQAMIQIYIKRVYDHMEFMHQFEKLLRSSGLTRLMFCIVSRTGSATNLSTLLAPCIAQALQI